MTAEPEKKENVLDTANTYEHQLGKRLMVLMKTKTFPVADTALMYLGSNEEIMNLFWKPSLFPEMDYASLCVSGHQETVLTVVRQGSQQGTSVVEGQGLGSVLWGFRELD